MCHRSAGYAIHFAFTPWIKYHTLWLVGRDGLFNNVKVKGDA